MFYYIKKNIFVGLFLLILPNLAMSSNSFSYGLLYPSTSIVDVTTQNSVDGIPIPLKLPREIIELKGKIVNGKKICQQGGSFFQYGDKCFMYRCKKGTYQDGKICISDNDKCLNEKNFCENSGELNIDNLECSLKTKCLNNARQVSGGKCESKVGRNPDSTINTTLQKELAAKAKNHEKYSEVVYAKKYCDGIKYNDKCYSKKDPVNVDCSDNRRKTACGFTYISAFGPYFDLETNKSNKYVDDTDCSMEYNHNGISSSTTLSSYDSDAKIRVGESLDLIDSRNYYFGNYTLVDNGRYYTDNNTSAPINLNNNNIEESNNKYTDIKLDSKTGKCMGEEVLPATKITLDYCDDGYAQNGDICSKQSDDYKCEFQIDKNPINSISPNSKLGVVHTDKDCNLKIEGFSVKSKVGPAKVNVGDSDVVCISSPDQCFSQEREGLFKILNLGKKAVTISVPVKKRDSYSCDTGYTLDGKTCIKTVPIGDGKTGCPSGYNTIPGEDSNKCYKEQGPLICPSGYKQSKSDKNTCLKTIYCKNINEHLEEFNNKMQCTKYQYSKIYCKSGYVFDDNVNRCIKNSLYNCER